MKTIKLAAASAVGKSNAEKNIECQDIILSYADEKKAILVAADGAGSNIYAREGAEAVAYTVINLLKQTDLNTISECDLKVQTIKEIKYSLHSLNRSLSDTGSTLLCFMMFEDIYCCIHLGDGICLCHADVWKILSKPENGEFINETFLTTSPDMEEHIRVNIGKADGIRTVIIASDGISGMLADPVKNVIASACSDMEEWLHIHTEEEVSTALKTNLETVFSDGSDDDKCIGLLIACDN